MRAARAKAADPILICRVVLVACLCLLATACAGSVAESIAAGSREAAAVATPVEASAPPTPAPPQAVAKSGPDVVLPDSPLAPPLHLVEAVAPPPLPATPVPTPRVEQPTPVPVVSDPCLAESAAPGPRSFAAFRAPLPPAPVWNPPGPKRVGLQAGHWKTEQTPPELAGLQHGASGGGKQEWEVNLDIATRAARLLEAEGVGVDILPTTVPPRYRAHVFVSIHADGDPAGRARGFKIARPGFSSISETDDRLVQALYAAYDAVTRLPRDDENITNRMRYYYAFNSRRYCHAVGPGVPQAIVETGFLTSADDRALLLGNPEAAARGIADGILAFLQGGTP
jgi:N-acetylmuramoyl-L-alanine amidase